MKNWLLFSLHLICIQASAQNWQLLNPKYSYNYKNDTQQLIQCVILIDSIEVNGNDSVFYLNRIVTPCDTCSISGSLLYDQPQFLNRYVLKDTMGYYHFGGGNDFLIHTKDSIGSTWIFDSVQSITATISSVFADSIFSTLDSFKLIQLSNGDTIIISKSFGISQFPYFNSIWDYHLIGVNGLDVGEQYMSLADILGFDVGDYYSLKDGESACNAIYWEHCDKYSLDNFAILNKDSILNGIQYEMAHCHEEWEGYLSDFNGFVFELESSYFHESEIVFYDFDTLKNLLPYPNKLKKLQWIDGNGDSLYVIYQIHPKGPFIYYDNSGNPLCYNKVNYPVLEPSLGGPESYSFFYADSLPGYWESANWFEAQAYHYWNNFGNYNADSILQVVQINCACNIGIQEVDTNCSINFSPNPASSYATFSVDCPAQFSELRIVDLNRRTILSIPISKNELHDGIMKKINLLDFDSGFYVGQLFEGEKMVGSTKLIIISH